MLGDLQARMHAALSADGMVGCPSCTPECDPSGPRQAENHFAVRFGDCMATVRWRGEIVRNVYEVMAGPGGWAMVYVVPATNGMLESPIACPCGSGGIARALYESDDYWVSIKRRVAS